MANDSREEYKSGQHALDEKQVNALLLSFDEIQDKAMIAVAISLGLRREDHVNLKEKITTLSIESLHITSIRSTEPGY